MRTSSPSVVGDIMRNPQVTAAAGSIFASLLMALFEGIMKAIDANKPGSRPSAPPVADDDEDDTDAPPDTKPEVPAIVKRKPASLRVNFSGITRKKFPYKEGGGRGRVKSQGYRRVLAGEDGLQAGDVIDENITPYDQFGKPFMPGEGVNELLLRKDGFPGFVHNIHGNAYLVREAPKESDPFGCTPGLRIPSTFQDENVKPGYRDEVWDEISLPLDADGKACHANEAVTTLTVTTQKVRVTPWAADKTPSSEIE